MLTPKVKIIGLAGIEKQMRLGRGGLATPEVLEGVGRLGVRSITRDMRAQRSPDGTPYLPVNRYGRGGKRLLDTQRLIRSIKATISGSRVTITSDVFYAARQHYGGVVRPKRAKMLAIPLTRAVARAVAAAGSFRAAFPGAFVFTSKKGNVLLSRRTAGKGLDPIAVLKKSVRIPATRFLAVSTPGTQEIYAYINRMVLRAMEAA